MRYQKLIAGGLILTMLGICVLSVLVVAVPLAELSRAGIRLRAFAFDRFSSEATEEQRFTVNAPAQLRVENEFGEVTVTAADTQEIVVSMRKTAWGATQAEADEARAAMDVVLTQTGNTLTVRYESPSQMVLVGEVRASQVDFDITVPISTAVEVDTHSGRISLDGTTGEANLKTDFGRIEAVEVTGPLTAQTNSGEIIARQIEADAETISLRSDFGGIELEDAQADRVELDSSSGTLTLTDVTVENEVHAETDFGRIELEAVSGAVYDLKTNSGRITVDGAAGKLKAHTDFGDITVTDAEAVTLDLKSNSGSLNFSGSLGEGPHTVRTDFGAVTLAIPADATLTVDLKTDFGKIRSDFPITVSGEVENRLAGNVNGGGEALTVTTNNGNISLQVLK